MNVVLEFGSNARAVKPNTVLPKRISGLGLTLVFSDLNFENGFYRAVSASWGVSLRGFTPKSLPVGQQESKNLKVQRQTPSLEP